MSLAHYFINDPFLSFAALECSFDDAFDSRRALRDHVDTLRLRVDVRRDQDTDDINVTLTLDLPGLPKEDVSIDVHNKVLTVSGENTASSEYTEGGTSNAGMGSS